MNCTLLVLVTEPAGLIGSGGPGSPVHLGQLPVLPATDPQEVTEDVRLLLAVQLGHVLVRAHDVLH